MEMNLEKIQVYSENVMIFMQQVKNYLLRIITTLS
jgi:hypothetical protein